MSKEKIAPRANAAQINAIQPGKTERLVGDSMVANLFLVVSPKGRKTWRWTAKIASTGKSPKLSLGPWPSFGVAEARGWATDRNAERDRGHDPSALIAAREVEKKREATNSVRAVWEAHLKYKRSVGEGIKSMPEKERLIGANVVAKYGDKPMVEFSKADMREILQTIRERGSPTAANRVLTEMKAFLRWAENQELIPYNVAASMTKTRENGFRRHTTIEEMALIWRAAGALENKEAGDAFRLILLTGCRRMEAVAAKSAEYANGQWTIPRERAKNRKPCILPVSSEARAIFEKRADLASVFIDKAQNSTFQKPLLQLRRDVDKLAGRTLEHWDLHGCRHGFRTALTGERICTKDIAERIINHSSGGIDEPYDHNLYLAEKGEALDKWQARLLAEVAKQTGDNVVVLRA